MQGEEGACGGRGAGVGSTWARRRSVLACHGEGGRVSLDFVLKNREKLIKQGPIMQKISLNRTEYMQANYSFGVLEFVRSGGQLPRLIFNSENENRNFIRYENKSSGSALSRLTSGSLCVWNN